MTRKSSLLAWTLSAALALSALGCGGAFSKMMKSGEIHAQSGNWDAAAASYEEAARLNPSSEEARAGLRRARQMQAVARIAAARKHLERGELALAVITSREATLFDPQSREAQVVYADARGRALTQAEALLAEDKAREALELARAVRRGDPADPQAASLEGRCLDHIASRAYDRAIAYIGQNKLGNALLALREAQEVRPGYRDAAAREEATRAALEEEIRFILVVERASDADRTPVATRVEESLLRWRPEPRFRLSAATDAAPAPGAQAVRIQPRVSPLRRTNTVQTIARSCDYVCGVDRVANPGYDVATRRVAEAERRMRAADASVRRARRVVDQARKEVTDSAGAADAAAVRLKSARSEREACSSKKQQPKGCATEEARFKAAEKAAEMAEERAKEAKLAVTRAESEANEADTEKESARRDWERDLAELRATPTTVTVDRVCSHSYGVALHTFSGAVTLAMKVQVLGEPTPVELSPSTQTTSVADETFPPESGRCAEVAAGDPLATPSDADFEVTLAARVAEEIRGHVAEWYAGYVATYRTDYEAAKAAGRAEEANEAYVRYLLVGPGFRAAR